MRALILAALLATTAPAALAQNVYVTADNMLDVATGRMIQNPAIIIQDGVITQVGARASLQVPSAAEVVELPGVTLLPGLIDMHVHLDADATVGGFTGLEYTDAYWTVIAVPNAKKTLDAGFTTVRNLGDGDGATLALRDAIETFRRLAVALPRLRAERARPRADRPRAEQRVRTVVARKPELQLVLLLEDAHESGCAEREALRRVQPQRHGVDHDPVEPVLESHPRHHPGGGEAREQHELAAYAEAQAAASGCLETLDSGPSLTGRLHDEVKLSCLWFRADSMYQQKDLAAAARVAAECVEASRGDQTARNRDAVFLDCERLARVLAPLNQPETPPTPPTATPVPPAPPPE